MKSVLIALLLVATVLFAAAEPKKRGGKGRPERRRPWQNKFKECPNNCSDCQEGTCRACDDDFALITITRRRFSKTICVPCGPQLKRNNPALFLRQCVTECSRNCTVCENGSCTTCDDGFFSVEARLLRRKICVPCGPRMKKNWPDVFVKECTENGCGRNCASCTEPGQCTECKGNLTLFTPPGSKIIRCIKKCPLFHKLKKGSSPPRCEVKQGRKPNKKCEKTCAECTEGVCTKCFEPLILIKLDGDRSVCRKKCPLAFKKFVHPKTKAKICEKLGKKQRKGPKKNIADI